MIIAIGTDIIEVERIRRAIDDPRTGKRFLQRVYTEGEIAYCLKRRRSAESFAARFAAKEAVMKVLGRGFGGGIAWKEIEIVRDTGRPTIAVRGRALDRARAIGITRWHLSLTHTATEAMAYVIAEAD
jgi:holo-[acyl-carrier protein] synthase